MTTWDVVVGARSAGVGRRALIGLCAVVLVASGCSAFGSNDGDGVLILGADEVGPDPFTDDFAEAVPDEMTAIEDVLKEAAELAEADQRAAATDGAEAVADEVSIVQVAEARRAAVIATADANGLPAIAPTSEFGVGIYGGSGANVCDVEGMIRFLEANPAQAAAFADVQDVDVESVPDYLRSLTPGFLLDQATVINHTFTDNQAVPIPAVLEAGNAVLVDDQGVPRVRCKCGNPLLPGLTVFDGRAYDATQWADAVTASAVDPRVAEAAVNHLPEFTLGPPDWTGDRKPGALSLGESDGECGFFVEVEFRDNYLVAGPGPDLRLFEIGSDVELSLVWVRREGSDRWESVGETAGGTSEIDLQEVLGDDVAGERFVGVRICDSPNGPRTPLNYALGAEIDAVGAINSEVR